MRAAIVLVARVALLAAPTVLAFFSGGFFDAPRLWAGIAMWVLVAVAAVAIPGPLPRSGPALLALGGLAALALWSGLSALWAPLVGEAIDELQRLALYLGALLAGTLLLRPRAMGRAVEPALAAGATIVILYGLSERLVPGVVELAHTASGRGRLDQPLTYWNATGLLAALGLVLCARLVADGERRRALRAAAAAAAAPLGIGVFLSFSRGALLALAAGIVVVLVLAPDLRAQVRAAALTVGAGALCALAALPMDDLGSLSGSLGTREREGAILLVVLVVVAAAAALVELRLIRAEPAGPAARARRRQLRASFVIVGLLVMLVGGMVAVAAIGERAPGADRAREGATVSRLGSLGSSRYDYWDVALGTFADHPIAGTGAGGWRVEWLRERPVLEPAKDAHSLYLETAAELGLPGLLAVAALLTGILLAARAAWRDDPALAAGPTAVVIAWAAHAGLDWDWEMPAVTLPALICAGALLAASARAPEDGPPSAAPAAAG